MEVFESGGGRAVSERLSRAVGAAVPLLGEIPLHPQVTKANDEGGPIVLGQPGLPAGPRVDPDDEAELLANARRMQGVPRACAVSTQPATGSKTILHGARGYPTGEPVTRFPVEYRDFRVDSRR